MKVSGLNVALESKHITSPFSYVYVLPQKSGHGLLPFSATSASSLRTVCHHCRTNNHLPHQLSTHSDHDHQHAHDDVDISESIPLQSAVWLPFSVRRLRRQNSATTVSLSQADVQRDRALHADRVPLSRSRPLVIRERQGPHVFTSSSCLCGGRYLRGAARIEQGPTSTGL